MHARMHLRILGRLALSGTLALLLATRDRAYSRDRTRARVPSAVARASDVNLLLVGLLLITRSAVGSFCELLEVMLY